MTLTALIRLPAKYPSIAFSVGPTPPPTARSSSGHCCRLAEFTHLCLRQDSPIDDEVVARLVSVCVLTSTTVVTSPTFKVKFNRTCCAPPSSHIVEGRSLETG